jgi:hypothetical protein
MNLGAFVDNAFARLRNCLQFWLWFLKDMSRSSEIQCGGEGPSAAPLGVPKEKWIPYIVTEGLHRRFA